MKCLSIHLYWLEKILKGEKTIEVRAFNPKYRGEILLCSTKSNGISGQALAVATLKEVYTTQTDDLIKKACLNKEDIKYKSPCFWEIIDVRLIKPFDIKGQLGLFEREVTIVYI